jgi:GTP pyrophosphokinase
MTTIDPEIEKKEILDHYRKLLHACRSRVGKDDKIMIRKAFNFALEAHKDMRRKSGEPYIYHPIEVAQIAVAEIGLGATSVVCALLHDVVEDTDYTLDDIQGLFGEKVAKIIDGLTKISGIFDAQTESMQAENFRKMLLTLSDDVRVILIKFADRLHNMRTLSSLPPEKQLKIASETSFLYAPLAHRLGLYAIKTELEDLAFKYLNPEVFEAISQKIADMEPERRKFIQRFVAPIKKDLTDKNIPFNIISRTKSLNSIYQKMRKKEIPLEEVFDLFAIRIIVDVPPDQEKFTCFNVYSIVTNHYRPNKDRFRDWISIPKANGYEALHTTVMSPSGRYVEVQIRSKRMDEIAEKGYAAHWKYKDNSPAEGGLDEWLAKIRELLLNPESNALDFLDDFKMNLFADEIYVFTPKGELKSLPAKSTVLDFAYSIHTQLGNNCMGAKVNHKLVAMDYTLKSGDQIEVISSEKQYPKEEWTEYVNTAKAKSQIKIYLKEERKKIASEGKAILKSYFEEFAIEFNSSNINRFLYFNNIANSTDLYIETAKANLGIKEVKSCFIEKEKKQWYKILNPFSKNKQAVITEPQSKQSTSGHQEETQQLLLGSQIEKFNYTIATCCKPIPGDDVIGLLEGNDRIKVHRTNCKQAVEFMSKYGNKLVKAKWRQEQTPQFLAGIKINGFDRMGMIRDITNVISKQLSINIRSLNLETNSGIFDGQITVYIPNAEQLKILMESLRDVKGIEMVNRIN